VVAGLGRSWGAAEARTYNRRVLVFAAVVLFIGAVFNVIAWPRFFQRVAKDTRARDAAGRPTTFWRVHFILMLIGLAIAAASVVAAVLLLV